MLSKACNYHTKYMKEASDGFGCDRLLLGLRMIAKENGMETPAIFKDVANLRSTHWNLSTSQMNSEYCITGFGPVVEDGYGACYNIRKSALYFQISSYIPHPATNSRSFSTFLSDSLMLMQALCEAKTTAAL